MKMKPNPILRKEEVTSQVQVLAISGTQPAQVTLVQPAKRPDGKERAITQKTPVHDADLLTRLTDEAPPGTHIEATIVTEWFKNGYTTYLKDFRATASDEQNLNAA